MILLCVFIIKSMLVHLGQFVAHVQLWLHILLGSQEAGSRGESDDGETENVGARERENQREERR